MRMIYPVILCGGMGARLWPMSRVQQPKQFQPVNGKGSLSYFQTTVQRHRGQQFHDPIVVTSHRHIDLVRQQLNEIQCGGTIIGEPCARNTGPAVLAAALQILPIDPAALLLVLPSDHMIEGDLNATVLAMAEAAAAGDIITLGIVPTYAETGYGYILDGGETAYQAGLHHVARFVEKPNAAVAEALLAAGGAYWASGISLFSAETIVSEFNRLEPATLGAVRAAMAGAARVAHGLILQDFAFRHARSEPTERMIFEKSPLVTLAPITVRWDDIGAWAAVYDVNAKTDSGNVVNGDVMAMETTNSLIRSDGRLVVVVGMNDVIVVDTKDALLVTNRAHAQKVKQVVDLLKASGRAEIESHSFHATPWGGIEDLLSKAGYKLELLTVRPGRTAKINDHGVGASFLSVVMGEGAFFENPSLLSLPLMTGSVWEINKDTQVSLKNVLTTDLQALLLSMGQVAKNPSFAHHD